MLTKELLHTYFEYCDGDLIRKDSLRKRKTTPRKSEYATTMFLGKVYKTHRLIYMYHYGYMPKQIDHIDGNKYNNQVENLRACLPSNNSMNIGIRKNSATGFKGVTWEPNRQKWRARVCVQSKTVFSGRFDDLELADLVATEAREKYHGAFANHGKHLNLGV
jgi:hypothetical protein